MNRHIDGFIEYYEESLKDFSGEMLIVPCSSRTTAYPTGTDAYSFDSLGGWSSIEPYLAGVYALACQVKPEITYDEFLEAALKTGDEMEILNGDISYKGKLLNPKALIESL